MAWRPHLRTVFLLVNITILLLPLGGIAILRLYESELIRQTESELIAQGAVVAAAYREELVSVLRRTGRDSTSENGPLKYGRPVDERWAREETGESHLNPLAPTLDVAKDAIRRPAEDAQTPHLPPDQLAMKAAVLVEPILSEACRTTLAGIRVTDFRGTVVASTGSEKGLSLFNREEVRRALQGEPISLLRERIPVEASPPLESISRRGRVRVFTALPVIYRDRVVGTVVLSRTALDIMKALYLNRRYLVGGGIALVAVVIVVSLLTSLTVSRPVSELIEQAAQVSRGEKRAAVPLAKPGTYEVDRLSKALADMSIMLEKRADYIRTFASNVSHEFKTPLASMRGTVELLSDHFGHMSAEERTRFFQILQKDTDRLERLVKRLLELARADVLRPGTESADVKQIIAGVANRYRKSGLEVSVELDPRVRTVRMAPETLESILSNLLDNARQHGGENTAVTLAAGASDRVGTKFVELTVTDNGKGISVTETAQIFNPFFTTAHATGGTGLGLAIVKALVTSHGGDVSVEPSETGARFLVRLPAR